MSDATLSRLREKSSGWGLYPLVLAASTVPLVWILGLDFIAYQIIAFILLARNYKAFRVLDWRDLLFIALAMWLTLSLAFAPSVTEVGVDRLVGAVNNISLVLTFFIKFKTVKFHLSQNYDPSVLVKIAQSARNFIILFVVCSSVLFLFWMVTGQSDRSIPTLLGIAAPRLPGIVGQSQVAHLVLSDWLFGGKFPRSYIFAQYATTVAAVLVFALSIYIICSDIVGRMLRDRRARSFFISMCLLAVFMTLARSTLFAMAVALVGAWLIIRYKAVGLVILAWIATAVAILYFAEVDWFDAILDARSGSSDTRMHIYELSIATVMDSSPVVGLGVKPREDGLLVPIGSHSSVISFLVRGGMVGAIIGVLAYLAPLLLAVSRCVGGYLTGRLPEGAVFAAAMSLAFVAYFAAQDIDAYGVVAFFGGTYLGLLDHISRQDLRSPMLKRPIAKQGTQSRVAYLPESTTEAKSGLTRS